MADMPVISNHVLHGMPAFVRHEIGQKASSRSNPAARLACGIDEADQREGPAKPISGFSWCPR
jgi:hypothetical protein